MIFWARDFYQNEDITEIDIVVLGKDIKTNLKKLKELQKTLSITLEALKTY